MEQNAVGNLGDVSWPWPLVSSIFGKTANNVSENAGLKLPLTVSRSEIYWMGAPDVRIGGFGPFFSAALVGCVVLSGIAVLANRRRPNKTKLYPGFALAAATLTIVVLLFPLPSVARYVPHLWAAPLLVLAAVEPAVRENRGMIIVVYAVLSLFAINSALAFTGNFLRTVVDNRHFYSLVWRLDAEPIPVVIVPTEFDIDFYLTLRHRLENRASSVEIRETYDCDEVFYVYHHYAKVCR